MSARRLPSATSPARLAERDRPWVMRTYAGHSSAAASNALFRRNLAKGQTGLSSRSTCRRRPATTPTTSWPAVRSAGSACRWRTSATRGPSSTASTSAAANTSMTINATAMWLLALYVTVAQEQGAPLPALTGTTQNDIVKEYLSRGTYIFPPGPSLRLTTDMIAWTVTNCPKWNPVNICSYHLQEAGATPVQEVGFALATAVAVLDAVRDSGQVPPERMGDVVAAHLVLRQRRRALRRGDGKMRAFARALGRAHRASGTA